jgi:hypothetical protein
MSVQHQSVGTHRIANRLATGDIIIDEQYEHSKKEIATKMSLVLIANLNDPTVR